MLKQDKKINYHIFLNLFSEASVKIIVFIFMSKIALNWDTINYSTFVAVNALFATFLPLGNLGIDTNYLLEKKFRDHSNLTSLFSLKIFLSIICAIIFSIYSFSLYDFKFVIAFCFLIIAYALNSEFALLSKKKYKVMYISNFLFVLCLSTTLLTSSVTLSLTAFVFAFVIKFLYQRLSFKSFNILEFNFSSFKILKTTSRFVFVVFIVQLYMNLIKISIHGDGNHELLKSYDLLLRFFLLFELTAVIIIRQFSYMLFKLKNSQIFSCVFSIWTAIFFLFYLNIHSYYLDYFNISINDNLIIKLFYLFISISISNQILGQFLQSIGSVKLTLKISLVLLSFVSILVFGLNFNTSLFQIGLLICSIKVIEFIYYSYHTLVNFNS